MKKIPPGVLAEMVEIIYGDVLRPDPAYEAYRRALDNAYSKPDPANRKKGK